MGILANHAASIEPLRAGLLEVIESAGTSKKFFGEHYICLSIVVGPHLVPFTVSGGFATVHPNNMLTINAVEGAPLDHFSAEVSPYSVFVCNT
jgi:F-type H+-transporting ATPase subunit delta